MVTRTAQDDSPPRPGWRPSTATRCPRVVAGRRCQAYGRGDAIEPCICLRWHSPLLDHPRMWHTAEGGRVLTAEPYGFSGDDLAGLVAECGQLGLSVSVSGSSPYYPGATVLITIRRRVTPPPPGHANGGPVAQTMPAVREPEPDPTEGMDSK